MLKSLVIDNHTAKFHGCSDENIRENASVTDFQRFPSAPDSLTLEEDNVKWYALKDINSDYHHASLHDCTDDGVWENARVTVFQDFLSTTVIVTLDEGHKNWYDLKGLVPNYHCVKFPESVTTVAKENLPHMY